MRIFAPIMGALLFSFAIMIVPAQPVLAQTVSEVWVTTKDTKSIAILEAFVEAFPDSIYAKLAKARIKELRGQSGSDGGADEQLPAKPTLRENTGQAQGNKQPEFQFANRRELVRAIQTELKKQRCYSAKVDGIWGNGSRRAVDTFIQYAGVATDGEPSRDLYNTVRATSGPVCPLSCGARFVVGNGKCVLKTCKKGERLSRRGKCVKPVAKRPCNEWRWRDDTCTAYVKNMVCYIPKSEARNLYCGCPQRPPPQFRHCKYRIVGGAG